MDDWLLFCVGSMSVAHVKLDKADPLFPGNIFAHLNAKYSFALDAIKNTLRICNSFLLICRILPPPPPA